MILQSAGSPSLASSSVSGTSPATASPFQSALSTPAQSASSSYVDENELTKRVMARRQRQRKLEEDQKKSLENEIMSHNEVSNESIKQYETSNESIKQSDASNESIKQSDTSNESIKPNDEDTSECKVSEESVPFRETRIGSRGFIVEEDEPDVENTGLKPSKETGNDSESANEIENGAKSVSDVQTDAKSSKEVQHDLDIAKDLSNVSMTSSIKEEESIYRESSPKIKSSKADNPTMPRTNSLMIQILQSYGSDLAMLDQNEDDKEDDEKVDEAVEVKEGDEVKFEIGVKLDKNGSTLSDLIELATPRFVD